MRSRTRHLEGGGGGGGDGEDHVEEKKGPKAIDVWSCIKSSRERGNEKPVKKVGRKKKIQQTEKREKKKQVKIVRGGASVS